MIGRALAVVLLVTGCSKQNPAICMTPPALEASVAQPNTVGGYEEKLRGCVHRWAYRIASADGSVSELGRAAVGGCEDALLFYASAKGEPTDADPEGYAREYAKALAIYQRQGAFFVASARAGKCDVP